MELIISIVSGVTAIISVFISCFGFIHNRFLAVDEFLTKVEDDKFLEVKKYIYNHNGAFDIDDGQAAIIVNFSTTGAYWQKCITYRCGSLMAPPAKACAACIKRQKTISTPDTGIMTTHHMASTSNG